MPKYKTPRIQTAGFLFPMIPTGMDRSHDQELQIGQQVRQAAIAKVGHIIEKESHGFLVIYPDGSASHNQSLLVSSPLCRVEPIEPTEIIDDEAIAALRALNTEYEQRQQLALYKATESRQEETERQIAEMRAAFPLAAQIKAGQSEWARCAKNVRMDLGIKFPGHEFKVKSDTASMSTSVDITWQNGPTMDEVNAVVSKYQYEESTGAADDSTRHKDTPFDLAVDEVLGRVRFVGLSRSASPEVKEALERGLAQLQQVEYVDHKTVILPDAPSPTAGEQRHQLFHATSFPTNFDPTALTVEANPKGVKHWAKVILPTVIEIAPISKIVTSTPRVEVIPAGAASAPPCTPFAPRREEPATIEEPLALTLDMAVDIEEAAAEIAAAQQFIPKNEDDVKMWFLVNRKQIAQLAMRKQWARLEHTMKNADALIEERASSLYHRLNRN